MKEKKLKVFGCDIENNFSKHQQTKQKGKITQLLQVFIFIFNSLSLSLFTKFIIPFNSV
jgi:hypothetical protein